MDSMLINEVRLNSIHRKSTKKLIWILGGVALLSFKFSFADELNLPQDELAQESVLPRFDSTATLKGRNIQDIKALDIGIFTGFAITEPISSTSKFGFSLNYHLSEWHMMGLIVSANGSGLSRDAETLKNDFGLDFTRAPDPKSAVFLDYNYKVYYGKFSFTKSGVTNTSIYISSMLGAIQYVHKMYPALSIGAGERFYLTNNLALKFDLRIILNNAPIPFKSGALRTGIDPIPTHDSFSERMTTTTHLEAGLNYIF